MTTERIQTIHQQIAKREYVTTEKVRLTVQRLLEDLWRAEIETDDEMLELEQVER